MNFFIIFLLGEVCFFGLSLSHVLTTGECAIGSNLLAGAKWLSPDPSIVLSVKNVASDSSALSAFGSLDQYCRKSGLSLTLEGEDKLHRTILEFHATIECNTSEITVLPRDRCIWANEIVFQNMNLQDVLSLPPVILKSISKTAERCQIYSVKSCSSNSPDVSFTVPASKLLPNSVPYPSVGIYIALNDAESMFDKISTYSEAKASKIFGFSNVLSGPELHSELSAKMRFKQGDDSPFETINYASDDGDEQEVRLNNEKLKNHGWSFDSDMLVRWSVSDNSIALRCSKNSQAFHATSPKIIFDGNESAKSIFLSLALIVPERTGAWDISLNIFFYDKDDRIAYVASYDYDVLSLEPTEKCFHLTSGYVGYICSTVYTFTVPDTVKSVQASIISSKEACNIGYVQDMNLYIYPLDSNNNDDSNPPDNKSINRYPVGSKQGWTFGLVLLVCTLFLASIIIYVAVRAKIKNQSWRLN